MMTNNSLMYLILWILIQLLFEGSCQDVTFKPKRRHDHTATIIDDKLYILGGCGYGGDHQFFYLDFDTIDTQNLKWNDLSIFNTVPSYIGSASVKGGSNNDTLIIYSSAMVYTFDPAIKEWSTQHITGDNVVERQFLTAVRDYNGKMYLFVPDKPDMLIIDTINLIKNKGNLINAPSGRSDYGAVLLPNRKIIYTGCFDNGTLNKVYLYDTINDTWKDHTTTGNIPSNREYFTASLGIDDNRVIIFGGRGPSELASEDALYELDLINYEWKIPNIYGEIPKSRFWHKANVFNNYMVISFGCCYNQSVESDILLLDIENQKSNIAISIPPREII